MQKKSGVIMSSDEMGFGELDHYQHGATRLVKSE